MRPFVLSFIVSMFLLISGASLYSGCGTPPVETAATDTQDLSYMHSGNYTPPVPLEVSDAACTVADAGSFPVIPYFQTTVLGELLDGAPIFANSGPKKVLAVDGDSLATWPPMLMQIVGTDVELKVNAYAGKFVIGDAGTMLSQESSFLTSSYIPGGMNVFLFEGGTNDMFHHVSTPVQTYTGVKLECDNAKAMGWTTIYSEPPRPARWSYPSDGGASVMEEFIALIRANPPCDYLVRVWDITALEQRTPDGTHPYAYVDPAVGFLRSDGIFLQAVMIGPTVYRAFLSLGAVPTPHDGFAPRIVW